MLWRIGCLALLTMATSAGAQEAGDQPLRGVAASRIVTVSDGDFLASTYGDANLAPYGRYQDVLTVLTRRGDRFEPQAISVSNSVSAAPEVLAVAPDGRTFYVVDRQAPPTPGARTTADLAAGRTLTAVQTGSDGRLSVLATRQVAPSSEALAINADGSWLAIVGNEERRSVITLVPLTDGVPGEPVIIDAGELGLGVEGTGPRGGMLLTNVQWRADGTVLAINDAGRNRIAFFRFTDGATPRLVPWGDPVTTGRDPFVGRFSADGRFYITSEWGRDFAGRDLNSRIPTTPGTLGVTRLSDDGRHARVGETRVGNSPEGIAISPDGRLIATVNMRSTAFPTDAQRFTREASVSLVSFDPESGALSNWGETFFEGVLPEGASFDATGEYLLVTVFQGHQGQRDQSGLAVFRVEAKNGRMSLVEQGRHALPHGVHHVVVVP